MLIEANKQSMELTGVGNARELGGYPTADGRYVRRGVLQELQSSPQPQVRISAG